MENQIERMHIIILFDIFSKYLLIILPACEINNCIYKNYKYLKMYPNFSFAFNAVLNYYTSCL